MITADLLLSGEHHPFNINSIDRRATFGNVWDKKNGVVSRGESVAIAVERREV